MRPDRKTDTMPDTHPALDTIRAQVDAWNRGDLDGYIALTHPDIVYIRGDGLIRGREALRERYTAAEGQLSVTIEDHLLGAEQATLVLAWALEGATGRALVVCVPGPDGWRLRYDATLAG